MKKWVSAWTIYIIIFYILFNFSIAAFAVFGFVGQGRFSSQVDDSQRPDLLPNGLQEYTDLQADLPRYARICPSSLDFLPFMPRRCSVAGAWVWLLACAFLQCFR
ncbi:hypothetical protein CPC08DRAFT_70601 [Agrocybe pediades]|nr:hypothetical protein CPC08DRAFT_70601 [Agrocybe pediades]